METTDIIHSASLIAAALVSKETKHSLDATRMEEVAKQSVAMSLAIERAIRKTQGGT